MHLLYLVVTTEIQLFAECQMVCRVFFQALGKEAI